MIKHLSLKITHNQTCIYRKGGNRDIRDRETTHFKTKIQKNSAEMAPTFWKTHKKIPTKKYQLCTKNAESFLKKKDPSHGKSTEILLKKRYPCRKKSTENFSKTTHV